MLVILVLVLVHVLMYILVFLLLMVAVVVLSTELREHMEGKVILTEFIYYDHACVM